MQPDKLITLLDTITATLDQAAESIEEVAAVVDHLRHARTAAIEQQMADGNGQPPDSLEKLHW